jgi:hypothetical protein
MERLTTKDFIKAPVAGLTLCQRTLIRDVPPSTERKENGPQRGNLLRAEDALSRTGPY